MSDPIEPSKSESSSGPERESPVPLSQPAAAHADPTHPAPPPQSVAAPESGAEAPPSVVKKVGEKVIAHPVGKVAAVILGALLGLAVEAAVDSTGVLGPGIDSVIARQSEGFAHLEARLDALRATSDPAETKTIITEIEKGVEQQKAYAERTADELRGARTEIQKLKAEALEAKGSASGADVWLGPGEGITIGKHGYVFTYVKPAYTGKYDDIYVNTGAGAKRFYLGGRETFETPEGVWTVVFKQATPRGDGRLGFDVVPPGDSKAGGG